MEEELGKEEKGVAVWEIRDFEKEKRETGVEGEEEGISIFKSSNMTGRSLVRAEGRRRTE